MKSNIKKIRQEIERLINEYKPVVGGVDELTGAHIILAKLLAFIDSLPDEQLTWKDIRRIVRIADGLLDDPKARVEYNNHNEEYYYKKVLDEYNRLHQATEG